MLHLNESLLAYDPAEALKDEVGKFEVTSPAGEKFILTSRTGHSITNIRVEHNGYQHQQWRIRKVGELGTAEETK